MIKPYKNPDEELPIADEIREVCDGWGNPFPEESQQLHWQYVKICLEKCELEKNEPVIPPEQNPWKELPAGWWDKSPKQSLSLDG